MSKAQIIDWKLRMLLEVARDQNLTPAAVRVMMYLLIAMEPGEKRNVSIAEVQDALGIAGKGTISEGLKNLEKNGYVKRKKSGTDKRANDVQLLASGFASA